RDPDARRGDRLAERERRRSRAALRSGASADYGSAMTPTRDDVLRARETIGDRLPRTPLLSSRTVGARLKCELFQRTGSFKARGALNKISSLSTAEKNRGVIAISAGNHAQAVAYAAAAEGIDALVVMWRGASEQKIAATRGYGAQVDLQASNPAEAFERLHTLQEETGRTLVHPFDDPLVLAGGIATEICKHLERVLVSEDEIEHAFRTLYERAKLACEPAGAVATAAWLAGKVEAENPVLLVSGGNVAGRTAAAILASP